MVTCSDRGRPMLCWAGRSHPGHLTLQALRPPRGRWQPGVHSTPLLCTLTRWPQMWVQQTGRPQTSKVGGTSRPLSLHSGLTKKRPRKPWVRRNPIPPCGRGWTESCKMQSRAPWGHTRMHAECADSAGSDSSLGVWVL